MNYNDILTRLNNGETIEDIATNMTAILNEAKDAYEKAQAAKRQEEEERKAKVVQEAAVHIATEHLASSLLDWAYVAFPDMRDVIEGINEAALVDMLENTIPQYQMFLQFTAMTQNFVEDAKAKSVEKKPSADKILENFLKTNFLA